MYFRAFNPKCVNSPYEEVFSSRVSLMERHRVVRKSKSEKRRHGAVFQSVGTLSYDDETVAFRTLVIQT
jgi:hypothetical protein